MKKRGPSKPFSSPGGKEAWREMILGQLPTHKVYVEPYAGSATIFFAKAKTASEREVLADINPEIIETYKFLRDGTDKDFTWMRAQTWQWDPSTFRELKSSSPRSTRKRAYRYKYLNLFSKRGEGLEIATTERARANTGKRFLDDLELYRERLEGVELRNEDGLDVLEEFDGADTLSYLDPPWKKVAAGIGWEDFDAADFAKRVTSLKSRMIVSFQGELELGESWSSVEVEASLGGIGRASKQRIFVNFDATKKSWFDAHYDCYQGGSHTHWLKREDRTTEFDGPHAHLFLIGARVFITEYGGEHLHSFADSEGTYTDPGSPSEHQHSIVIDERAHETELGGMHVHELLDVMSSFDGLHQHQIKVGEETLASLSPGQFWALFRRHAAKSAPAPKFTYPSDREAPGAFIERRTAKGIELIFGTKLDGAACIWSIDITRKAGDAGPFVSPLGDGWRRSIIDQQLAATQLEKLSTDERPLEDVVLDRVVVEMGVQTQDLREFFLRDGNFYSGRLLLERSSGAWTASLSKSDAPLVSVIDGIELPAKRSLLPASLERSIPDALRFWEGKSSHREFVASKVLEHVRVVDKQLTRCESKIIPAPEPPQLPSFELAKACARWGDGAEPVRVSAEMSKRVDVVKLATKLKRAGKPFMVEWPNTVEAQDALAELGPVFRAKHDPRIIYVASAPLLARPDFERVLDLRRVAELEKSLPQRTVELAKVSSDEERFVLGIVLEPRTADDPDLQDDFYTVPEIRKACHGYMEKHGNAGLMHRTIVNDKIKVLENWLAPVDFEIDAPNGPRKILQGTWLIGFGIRDDEIWTKVKDGTYRGPSLGGFARREPRGQRNAN